MPLQVRPAVNRTEVSMTAVFGMRYTVAFHSGRYVVFVRVWLVKMPSG